MIFMLLTLTPPATPKAVWPVDLWGGGGIVLLIIVLLLCILSFMYGMHVANQTWIVRHHGPTNRPQQRPNVVPNRKEER